MNAELLAEFRERVGRIKTESSTSEAKLKAASEVIGPMTLNVFTDFMAAMKLIEGELSEIFPEQSLAEMAGGTLLGLAVGLLSHDLGPDEILERVRLILIATGKA